MCTISVLNAVLEKFYIAPKYDRVSICNTLFLHPLDLCKNIDIYFLPLTNKYHRKTEERILVSYITPLMPLRTMHNYHIRKCATFH